MAISAIKKYSGLTLVEVVIALAIIAIAMTAVMKAVSQQIRTTAYLQDKTTAMWVGEQVVNEARLGLLGLPDASNPLLQTEDRLGKIWYWQAWQENTANKQIRKILVQVFDGNPDNKNVQRLVRLEGYYHA